MKKLNLIIALTAVLLVGLTVAFKYANAPTGAATSSMLPIPGNAVTLIAVLAIAGIVVVTVMRKD
jgi:hypothetical protein